MTPLSRLPLLLLLLLLLLQVLLLLLLLLLPPLLQVLLLWLQNSRGFRQGWAADQPELQPRRDRAEPRAASSRSTK